MPKDKSPIDAVVGQNIVKFRRMLGVSQSALGERLNVSFQQVQKYEKGTNRITVGKLVEVAGALNVTIQDLLEGAGDVQVSPLHQRGSSADNKLARELGNIGNEGVRQALRSLIKAVAGADPVDEDNGPPE